jgi:hypothetical protein
MKPKPRTRIDDHDPSRIAQQLGMGFVYHDEREREKAIDAFAAVDTFQFRHVSEATAREASVAYVDALWAKDEIEDACTVDGELDRDALDEADWAPVTEAFERRASLVDMDPAYAEYSTVAWRRHKTGGDYWTPMQKAQMYELRAALQDPDYPHKPRDGQSGFGPEPTRYVLGVELHDMRKFEEGLEAMTPYFERIAHDQRRQTSDEWKVHETQ